MHQSKTMFRRTLGDAWLRASGFHPPVHGSKERLFEQWTLFRNRFLIDAARLTAIGRKYLGIDLKFVDPPILGFDVASLSYNEALTAVQETVHDTLHKATLEFSRCRVGTIAWSDDGDSCRFRFHEVHRRRGLFRELVGRTPHEHELVRARVRRVDDKDAKLPKVAQAIVNELTPELRRELRVVVGTEIVRNVGEREVKSELTPLGQALIGAGKKAAQTAVVAGPLVAKGLVGSAAFLGAGLVASAVFLADPALVLGDVCLYGWELD